MWFLKFWAISTIICILVSNIIVNAMIKKITRELKINRKNYGKASISERLASLMPLFIPFLNIVITISVILNQENTYNKMLEKYKSKEESK